jgi:CRP-like cAMP-binding protein
MESQFKNMYQVISSYIEITDQEWTSYSSMLGVKKIKKKTRLLSEGTLCKEMFFINSGLLRIYFVDNNGEEKTFHLALENTFPADYQPFLKGSPSNYSIQAMEDTEVFVPSLEMGQGGYQKLQQGEKLGRRIAEDYFMMFNDKIQAIYAQTPLEHYKDLMLSFPNIFQRVPQHFIASYLNISAVHLSRLKNAEPSASLR